ncbi:hypothetical protein DDE82_002346 [Stemphylium lycopersici]|nr:hypothetical protein DDE82_002346 [Stemphylium lycopersici]
MTAPSDQQDRLSIISELLSQSHNTGTDTDTASLANDVKKLDVQDPKTLQGKVDAYFEESAAGSLTDRIAKDSSDSTASDHQHHDTTNQASHAQAHKANPGPVVADNMPEAASKEELKKRAEELNK